MTINWLEQQYPIFVRPDRCTDGSFCWVAEHPDLPGCGAHGDTIAEAKTLLDGVRKAYIKDMLSQGETPPIPNAQQAVEWQVGGDYTVEMGNAIAA